MSIIRPNTKYDGTFRGTNPVYQMINWTGYGYLYHAGNRIAQGSIEDMNTLFDYMSQRRVRNCVVYEVRVLGDGSTDTTVRNYN